MFFHEHLPEAFDDFLIYNREYFEMPQEQAFSVSIIYSHNGEEHCWKKVWYLPKLEIRLMEVELGERPEETIADMAKEQIHNFKKDISHYLHHMNYEMVSVAGGLVLQEKIHAK
ncbi:hypothetical protein [Vibrio sp. 99-8-1]|uniref:hypothetical protein n=1 Tax=Vibrio sp. 99-8-1 TaxID=2607602 RepID=UPI0014935072|nr:hypothetical protein [Vibrio sp. 99-8-1]NOI65767.1 hypothetical protein [Vibrio sp. 99-8-1]